MPVDYSKWKDIEVSDDEDDTHPNIDTPSLFRWRHQARLERMAEKKQKQEDIDQHKKDYKSRMEELQTRMADSSLDEPTKKKLKVEYDENEELYRKWLEKEAALADQEKGEKWNVDTITHDKWSTTRINKASGSAPAAQKTEEEEMKEMRVFFDKHEKEIVAFSKLKSFQESEKYLIEHPYLCHEWTANHITLDALNAGIMEKEGLLQTVARQVISLQYLLELAKQLKANPQSPTLIQGFFRKINAAEESYMKMYTDEVDQFINRVHMRAAVKRQEAMKEAEEEERQARIAQSPGGIDPIEVLESLPKEMRDAFEAQDIPRLQQVAAGMPIEEFQNHLDRCVASGLWLPNANAPKDEEKPAEGKAGDVPMAE